jgi:hypothetical protein
MEVGMATATTWRKRFIPSAPPRASGRSQEGVGQAAGWWTTGLLVVVTLLLINVLLVAGIYTGRWDAADFFCPFQMLLGDCARQGQFLLWTPLINAGCPACSDPQIGAFSPLTVGIGALLGGHEVGFRVYWLLIWALGGAGIVLLARHFAAPTWAAYVAAVGFMFCGTYTGHAEHTCFLEVISLFPWVLWRWDVAILRRSLAAAAQAGALWGLSALAGYPGLIIIGGFYIGLWTIGRLLLGRMQSDPPATDCRLGWKLVSLFLVGLTFFVVAIAVMSPAYAGFLVDGRGYTERTGQLPRDFVTNLDALHPKALATFASPHLAVLKLSNPEESLYPGSDVSTCSVYLSPVLLVLAAVALWHRPRERFRWYLAAMAVFCLLCAMGSALPLRGWLYDILPPMRYFRHSGLFRCYYLLTVVVLALLASRSLQETLAWRAFAIAGALATTVACVAFVLVCVSVPSVGGVWNLGLAAVHLAGVWLGVTVAARIGQQGDTAARTRVLQRYLVWLVIADAIVTVIISKPTMYQNRGKLWNAVEEKHVASLDLGGNGLNRILCSPLDPWNANLPMKIPTLGGYSALLNDRFKQSVAHPILANSTLGTNRIWFSRQAACVPLADDSLRRLVERTDKLGRLCLVVSDPEAIAGQSAASSPGGDPAFAALDATAPAEPVPVTLVKYLPNELVLDAACPADGWILVTDRWAPGWRATVNGRCEPIAVGNLLFRAVRVEKGINHVCFSYRPFGYPWLVMGSWAGLGLVLGGPLVIRGIRSGTALQGVHGRKTVFDAGGAACQRHAMDVDATEEQVA